MEKPAAKVADPVQHPLPPVLTPTTGGSLNVLIGGFPAWRGFPAASAAIIQEAKLIEAIASLSITGLRRSLLR